MARRSAWLLSAALTAAALLAAASGGAAASEASRFALEIGAGAPSQRGHLQTPAGGQPGTASDQRPTLRELALADGHDRWLAGSARFGRYAISARYAQIGDAASAVLNAPLRAQGQSFAAGETLHSRASFDALSLALLRGFRAGSADRADSAGTRLRIAAGPWLGWTAFHFEVDGANAAVRRRYRVYALGAQARADMRIGGNWQVSATATIAPALLDGAAGRLALDAGIGYRATRHLHLRLGARIERFRYDDAHKQTLPNRLAVRRSAVPTLAAQWRW